VNSEGLLHACLAENLDDQPILMQSEDTMDELVEKILDFSISDSTRI
jgi:hypothetical protein